MEPLLGGPDREACAAKLRPRWARLCKELGVSGSLEDKWWACLETRHWESQRAYHTLAHLVELFDHFDQHAGSIVDSQAVRLAIFFHDAIYNPRAGSPKNEKDSAVLFDAFGQEALPPGAPPGLQKGELISKVCRWIRQTASHKVGSDDDEDCKLFMDFDMAILGAPSQRYDQYAKQIRFEYSHVGAAIFYRARGQFLAGAATAGALVFATETFGRSHEQAARENMAREAGDLAARFSRSGACPQLLAKAVLSPLLKKVAKPAIAVAALAVVAFQPRLVAGLGAAVLAALALSLLNTSYKRYPYPTPTLDGKTVVLAGSYNPPHFGHLEMLKSLSQAHHRVVAVIGVNPEKKYDVSPYQRQEIMRAMLRELELTNVEVAVWGGIIFQYAHSVGASIMYRGIRTWRGDGPPEKFLELQNIVFQIVQGLWPLRTAYLQGAPHLQKASSTLLRERLREGDDISDLVPRGCAEVVKEAYLPESKTQ